jgi:hypothetical protein
MKRLNSIIAEKISQSPEFEAELEPALNDTCLALTVARIRESRNLTQGEVGTAIDPQNGPLETTFTDT